MEVLPTVVLAELVLRLSPGTGGAVGLQVGETFVDLGLVTDTGNTTPVGVTQGRHQAAGGGDGGGEVGGGGVGGGGINQPPALDMTLFN